MSPRHKPECACTIGNLLRRWQLVNIYSRLRRRLVPLHSVVSRARSLQLACRHYCFWFSVQNSQKRHNVVAIRYCYMSNINHRELDKRQQNQGANSAAGQSQTALITYTFLWHSAESGVQNKRGQSQRKPESDASRIVVCLPALFQLRQTTDQTRCYFCDTFWTPEIEAKSFLHR
jgi:uncharacterized glyoxalase superfamily metalloenzyme YdcJ